MFWSMRQASDQSSAEASAWRAVIVRRWHYLNQMIARQGSHLEHEHQPEERANIEYSLRFLKRAALSVWMDAQTEGVDLGADLPPRRQSDVGHADSEG